MFVLYRSYSEEGYTIAVDRLDLRWKPIVALCKNLEHEFHHPIAANLYLTPRTAQGFLPHFDTHDAFILQLHGSKIWRLYDSPLKLPLAEMRCAISEQGFGPSTATITLRAGDLLYIPRGQVHEALTGNEASLHLTVGIHVFRWADFIAEAVVTAAEQEESLREALPVGFLRDINGSSVALKKRMQELLACLVNTIDCEKSVGRLARRLLSNGQPLPDGHFVSLNELASLGLNSVVTRRPEMLCRVIRNGESVSIHYLGNSIVGPSALEPALQFIATSQEFVVSNLPDDLADEDKIALTRRFVREGLLKMTSPSNSDALDLKANREEKQCSDDER
jgi:ribosomal protein L16 Arg81 hydroxylase